MNKIINGKRYNTESAKKLAVYSHGSRNDFGFYTETLYRKNTGELFLHGEGYAASKYAEVAGRNEWKPGEKIIPLDESAARKWAEQNLTGDEYEKIFGAVQETEPETKLVRISAETSAILEKIKAKTGDTYMSIVGNLVKEYAIKMDIDIW